VPGEGLRGITVGRATPADVLQTFGEDAELCRHDGGDFFKINYDHDAAEGGNYQPDRPAQWSRPSAFLFEYGLLKAINVGVYQKELRTAGGIRVGSTRDEVVHALGQHYESLTSRGDHRDPTDDIETIRYLTLGIQFGVHQGSRVGSFVIFQTRRMG